MRLMTAGALAFALVVGTLVGGLIARHLWIEKKIAALTGPPTFRFSAANAALSAKADGGRIVLIGDSSFARWPKEALPEQWRFVNRGVGGETTGEVAGRFDVDALALAPEAIVISAGLNDLVAAEFLPPVERRATIDKTFETLVDLSRRSAGRGARVFIATLVPPSRPDLLRLPVWREGLRDAVAEMNGRLRAFAARRGVDLVDFAAALGSDDRRTPDAFRADTLHLNAAGYRKLAEALERALGP